MFPQHHRGRGPRQDAWVFGVVDTSHQPWATWKWTTRGMRLSHVAPGTTIHSDQWRAYSQVAQLPPVSTHHTVNHSLHFVDQATGVHTQHVESYWNCVKVKLYETHEGLPPPPVAGVTSTNLCGGKDMGRLEKRRSPPPYKILHSVISLYNIHHSLRF